MYAIRSYYEQLKQEIEERKKAEEGLAERIRLEGLRGEVGVALAKGDTLRTLLQPCTEALIEHLGAAFARIWAYNEVEKMLELQASVITSYSIHYTKLYDHNSHPSSMIYNRRDNLMQEKRESPH